MRNYQSKIVITLAVFLAFFIPSMAFAGFTETLPQNMFLLDEAVTVSWVDSMWDDSGNSVALQEELIRYEPGGGLQGVLRPEPKARYIILINKLQYGILDNLSLGIGIPVIIESTVDPNFQWDEGNYQRSVGHPFSQQDFWDWAMSMGQSEPTKLTGNKGALSDIVVGLRFRWTDYIVEFDEVEMASSISLTGVIPTGKHADPEEVVSVGTSMWDLHSQGDMGFHLSFDKKFERNLDGRLGLGVDIFYELFFDRELTAATGEKHPLLLNLAPYIGDKYKVNPGDFTGFSFQIDTIPYYGPAWATNISDCSVEKAKNFPPILAFYIRYTFVHLQQTDWKSDFPIWDWDKEKQWLPGYKNILEANLMFSFMRLGAPLQVYVSYRTLSLIPGKNSRAPDILTTGIRVPMKFW